MIRSLAITVALVTLAGCAASETEEASADSSANLTAAECTDESEAVTVSLEEVATMSCHAMKGQYISLAFRGRRFTDYVSDDPAVCNAQVDTLRRGAWDNHGLRSFLISHCTTSSDGVTHRKSDLIVESQWRFQSWD